MKSKKELKNEFLKKWNEGDELVMMAITRLGWYEAPYGSYPAWVDAVASAGEEYTMGGTWCHSHHTGRRILWTTVLNRLADVYANHQ